MNNDDDNAVRETYEAINDLGPLIQHLSSDSVPDPVRATALKEKLAFVADKLRQG